MMATIRPVLSFLHSVKLTRTGRRTFYLAQPFSLSYMQKTYLSIFTCNSKIVKLCDFCRHICFSVVSCSDENKFVSNVESISKCDDVSSRTNRELTFLQNKNCIHIDHLDPKDTFGLLSQKRLQKSSIVDINHKNQHAKASEETSRLEVESCIGPVGGAHNVRARDKHWGDTFGTLTEVEDAVCSDGHTDSGDEEEHRHRPLSMTGQKHSPQWYGRQIEKLGKQWKVKEAIEILEYDMLVRDRVMPTPYVFTALLGVLGRSGYTKKAFQLFNKMKKMGLKPEDATYTTLFNACGNSPWTKDGLSRAHKLHDLMVDQGVQPNLINYKSMIKAFGVCGDLRTAFRTMDELTQHYQPDCESFSFLLMACISDRDAGFQHAIQVWQLMKLHNVHPDLPLYNLLLRATRDCAFNRQHPLNASSQTSNKLLQQRISKDDEGTIISDIVQVGVEAREDGRLADVNDVPSDLWWQMGSNSLEPLKGDAKSSSLSVITQQLNVGENSLLDSFSLNKAEHRLALLGGFNGWLTSMEEDHVKPDVKTFMQLFDFLSSMEAEEQLLSLMDRNGVKPDIDLLNNLIHKRCMKQDFEAAQDVLQLIEKHGLQVNMRTFCCLAMTCKKKHEGQRLLKDMENVGLVPNIEVLGTLVYASRMDFHYKLDIVKYCDMLNLKPNRKFLENAENNIAAAKAVLVKMEKGSIVGSYFKSDYFQSGFKNFMLFYRPWLQSTEWEKPTHPWKSFRHTKKNTGPVGKSLGER